MIDGLLIYLPVLIFHTGPCAAQGVWKSGAITYEQLLRGQPEAVIAYC